MQTLDLTINGAITTLEGIVISTGAKINVEILNIVNKPTGVIINSAFEIFASQTAQDNNKNAIAVEGIHSNNSLKSASQQLMNHKVLNSILVSDLTNKEVEFVDIGAGIYHFHLKTSTLSDYKAKFKDLIANLLSGISAGDVSG